jgi:hypothetical protein
MTLTGETQILGVKSIPVPLCQLQIPHELSGIKPRLGMLQSHKVNYRHCQRIYIEKNEMGGACSTYGGDERRRQGFGGEI